MIMKCYNNYCIPLLFSSPLKHLGMYLPIKHLSLPTIYEECMKICNLLFFILQKNNSLELKLAILNIL